MVATELRGGSRRPASSKGKALETRASESKAPFVSASISQRDKDILGFEELPFRLVYSEAFLSGLPKKKPPESLNSSACPLDLSSSGLKRLRLLSHRAGPTPSFLSPDAMLNCLN